MELMHELLVLWCALTKMCVWCDLFLWDIIIRCVDCIQDCDSILLVESLVRKTSSQSSMVLEDNFKVIKFAFDDLHELKF